MASVMYTITDDSVSVYVDGTFKTVPRKSENGRALLELIRNREDYPCQLDYNERLRRTVDTAKAVLDYLDFTSYSFGRITINGSGGVYTADDGRTIVLPPEFVERAMECRRAGVPPTALANFMDRLSKNPSKSSIDELFRFLTHRNLPITQDGYVLAYKAITHGWMDKHTGKICNRIGCEPSMRRGDVDDDRRAGCSFGLHCGSLEYVTSFACGYGNEGGDRIVIVRVDPADVVSVPLGCSEQKMRVCRYLVLSEYVGPLASLAVTPEKEYDIDDDDSFDDDDEYDLENIRVELRDIADELSVRTDGIGDLAARLSDLSDRIG